MSKKIRFLLISFIVAMSLLFIANMILVDVNKGQVTRLTEGWNVTLNDLSLQNIRLENMHREGIPDLRKGDTFVLSRKLPDVGKLDNPCLMLDVEYSAVEVYVGEDLVYFRGMSDLKENQFTGSDFRFALLPIDYAGKDLRIVLHVTEDHAYSGISGPSLGEYGALCRAFIQSRLIPFAFGAFLPIYGIAFLVMGVVFAYGTPGALTRTAGALLSILVGLWIIYRYRLAILLAPGADQAFLGMATLYLMVPFAYFYLGCLLHFSTGIFCRLIAILSSALSIAFVLLPLMGVVHINQFQAPNLILEMILTGVAAYYTWQKARERAFDASLEVQIVSVLVLCLFLLADRMILFLENLNGLHNSLLAQYLFPMGAMLFALTQILNYYIYVTEAYAKQMENRSLSRIAYADILTNLPNRASYDRECRRLDQSDGDYCIISFDLDGLKEVNDQSGHAEGDRLLQGFAKSLVKCFEDGFCSRIGGDEFTVILEEIKEERVERGLTWLVRRMRELDLEEPFIDHGCSFGYAFSHELQGGTHEVYLLADQRMYEMKKKHHVQEMGKA